MMNKNLRESYDSRIMDGCIQLGKASLEKLCRINAIIASAFLCLMAAITINVSANFDLKQRHLYEG